MHPLLCLITPNTPKRENPINKMPIAILRPNVLYDIPNPLNYSLANITAPNIIVPRPTNT